MHQFIQDAVALATEHHAEALLALSTLVGALVTAAAALAALFRVAAKTLEWVADVLTPFTPPVWDDAPARAMRKVADVLDAFVDVAKRLLPRIKR